MNFLILGDGAEELAWAHALVDHAEHRLAAAFPGFDALPEVPEPRDLDDALSIPDIEVVVVGGGLDFRAEALRRVAAAGLATICLHPPGHDSEPYYMVALSRDETGAVVVPDLPARLHPGVEAIRQALQRQELGAFRVLRHESPAGPEGVDLVRQAFPRVVDLVRALLGDVEQLTATGDPPGVHPSNELIVHLRCPRARRAEVRLWAGSFEPSRLIAHGTTGSITLEYDPTFHAPARLVRRHADGTETTYDIEPWDAHVALLDVLASAIGGNSVCPSLLDATRATELGEAAVRSLRRGRTIELNYEEISETGTFKSVMTSLGCMILISILFVLPVALMGPALGISWTLYIAYAIPPVLLIFVGLQALRWVIRKPSDVSAAPRADSGNRFRDDVASED